MSWVATCDAEACRNRWQEDAPTYEATQHSRTLECGICCDVILRKEDKAERFFGIQTHCNHVFCFGCISRWREEHDTCPMCRTPSALAIKTPVWVDADKTPDVKKDLIIGHYVCFFASARLPTPPPSPPLAS